MPTVLVTGAAKRVGRAVALDLARAGCDLVLTFNRSSVEIQSTFQAATSLGATVRVDRVDFADLNQADDYGQRLAASLTKLDAVVHNASAYVRTPLATVSARDLMHHAAVNAFAPLLLTRRIAAHLARSDIRGGGAVVALADIHACGEHSLPRRDLSAYAMSKAALIEMVRCLALELAPRVRVNAVAPGVILWPAATRNGADMPLDPDADASMREAYLSKIPLGREGTPEDAAETIRWLILSAPYITGQVVRLDGGRSLV